MDFVHILLLYHSLNNDSVHILLTFICSVFTTHFCNKTKFFFFLSYKYPFFFPHKPEYFNTYGFIFANSKDNTMIIDTENI